MPKEVELIFDMHRHGNWDICFTTPKITKVRPEIRAAAEAAYKHKNLALLGIPGLFLQSMHLAEDNGNQGDMYSARFRRVKKWVFQCYASTATGAFTDSKVGTSLFKNPRLLFLGAAFAGAVILISRHPAPTFAKAALGQDMAASGTAPKPDAGKAGPAPVDDQNLRRVASPAGVADPFSHVWRLVAVMDIDGEEMIYVSSGRRTMRVPNGNCKKNLIGWSCRVPDGIATWDTGDWVVPEDKRDTEAQARPA
ncbi:MAG: zonular occludens toxin domain-containing protein [Solimonas sp.]